MKAFLKGPQGQVKDVTVGFSWTTFFFGFFVPLFRGDAVYTLLMVLASICTYGISNLVFPFFYNKVFIKRLLDKGYEPYDEESRLCFVTEGIMPNLPVLNIPN